MERLTGLTCAGLQSLRSISRWTKEELAADRQSIEGTGAELKPRKRVRRHNVDFETVASPFVLDDADSPKPTVPLRMMAREAVVQQTAAPAPNPDLVARQGLVFDTVSAPATPAGGAASAVFTGTTVADSQQVQVPGATVSSQSRSTQAVSATPTPSAAPSSGMSVATEAIIISCSIAGFLVFATAVVLVTICCRRRSRRRADNLAMNSMPRRMQSSSTMRSDGWRSETSEPEKQALITSQSRSRSVSPATRGTSPNDSYHTQQRSLAGLKSFMEPIPESPAQPPSPTSIYTKKSPPQPMDPGQLQLQYAQMQHENGLHSPLKPPPLRIRQGQDDSLGSVPQISPKSTMFSSMRIPFMSGASHSRKASGSQSLASSYDEERGISHNRRTMESETLPPPGLPAGGYRDSFWSVAASSILKTKGLKSAYGDSVYASSDLRHTRTNSMSSGGHSRTASNGFGLLNSDDVVVAPLSGRSRSRSSVYSQRRPSEALIPALPPMPSRYEVDQTRPGHKSGLLNQSVASVGSQSSGPPGDFELKSRLHSVDFWAREERDMRLGTFAPAELDGSSHPTPITELPTPLEVTIPVIKDSPDSLRRHSNPYFAGTIAPGMQGGYSVAVQGGDGPVRTSTLMPDGYSHEATDDGRRFWNRGRSQERSRERSKERNTNSSSTVATVFKHHPGDMVMI